jgi:translation initiation factor IF-2
MAKVRIHELAKELKMNSKDLVVRLRQMGYTVKNHMSTIEEKDIIAIRKRLRPDGRKDKKGKNAAPQQPAEDAEAKEKDFRKRAQQRKEELRQKKEQNKRKIMAKVDTPFRSRTKRKRKDYQRTVLEDTEPKKIIIEDKITVQELANYLHVNGSEVIKKLIDLGVMASLNQVIDSETATLVASEFGVDVEVQDEIVELEAALDDEPDRPENMRSRPPVITVMGHVDHGKTSLLDYIHHGQLYPRSRRNRSKSQRHRGEF